MTSQTLYHSPAAHFSSPIPSWILTCFLFIIAALLIRLQSTGLSDAVLKNRSIDCSRAHDDVTLLRNRKLASKYDTQNSCLFIRSFQEIRTMWLSRNFKQREINTQTQASRMNTEIVRIFYIISVCPHVTLTLFVLSLWSWGRPKSQNWSKWEDFVYQHPSSVFSLLSLSLVSVPSSGL